MPFTVFAAPADLHEPSTSPPSTREARSVPCSGASRCGMRQGRTREGLLRTAGPTTSDTQDAARSRLLALASTEAGPIPQSTQQSDPAHPTQKIQQGEPK